MTFSIMTFSIKILSIMKINKMSFSITIEEHVLGTNAGKQLSKAATDV
jgi:hypothetical protein